MRIEFTSEISVIYIFLNVERLNEIHIALFVFKGQASFGNDIHQNGIYETHLISTMLHYSV